MITAALLIIAWTAAMPLGASIAITVIASVRFMIKGLHATAKFLHECIIDTVSEEVCKND